MAWGILGIINNGTVIAAGMGAVGSVSSTMLAYSFSRYERSEAEEGCLSIGKGR